MITLIRNDVNVQCSGSVSSSNGYKYLISKERMRASRIVMDSIPWIGEAWAKQIIDKIMKG